MVTKKAEKTLKHKSLEVDIGDVKTKIIAIKGGSLGAARIRSSKRNQKMCLRGIRCNIFKK